MQPRKDYHGRIRRDAFPLIPRNQGVLLDFGGGTGETALAIRDEGFAARVGVADILAADLQSPDLDFRYSANLEDPQAISDLIAAHGPFDTIIGLDIFEHLRDPWAAVKHLHQGLKIGGSLVASVPNVSHHSAVVPLFFGGRWDLQEAGLLDRTHLRFFVRDTAIALLTSSGLVLAEVRDIPENRRAVKVFNAVTLGMLNRFTTLQHLIRVTRTA